MQMKRVFKLGVLQNAHPTHYSYLQGNGMSPKNPTDIFDMVPFSAMPPLALLPASNGSAPPPPARPTEMSKFFFTKMLKNVGSFNHKVRLRRQSFYCHTVNYRC